MKKFKLLLIALFSLSMMVACSNQAPAEKKEEAKTEAKTEANKEEKSEEKKDEKKDEKSEAKKADDKSAEVKPVDKNTVFVSPQWVKSVIDGKQEESKNYVILDAEWGEEKDGEYTKVGHLPGAIHVNTDLVEFGPVWNLLPAAEMEKNMLAMGVNKDKTVILYSSDPSAPCRVAYAYLWAGVENVKVMDGGRKAWKEAGYEYDTKSNKPTPVTEFGAKVPVHPEYQMAMTAVKEKLGKDDNFQLISIRAEEEWLGKTSGYGYIPKAGEPKGAIWGKAGKDASNMDDYLNPDGTYISLEKMEAMYKDLGIDTKKDMSFYCGTGWRATIPFLRFYENGFKNISIYDGGWNEWIMDPTNEVQVGDPKSADVIYTTVDKLSDDKATKN